MAERIFPLAKSAIVVHNYPTTGLPCTDPCATGLEAGSPVVCAVCDSSSRFSGVRPPEPVIIFQRGSGNQTPTE